LEGVIFQLYPIITGVRYFELKH